MKRMVIVPVVVVLTTGCSQSASPRPSTPSSTVKPSVVETFDLPPGTDFRYTDYSAHADAGYTVSIGRALGAGKDEGGSVYVGVPVTLSNFRGHPSIGDDWIGFAPLPGAFAADDGSIRIDDPGIPRLYRAACAGHRLLADALSAVGADAGDSLDYDLSSQSAPIHGCALVAYHDLPIPTRVGFYGASTTPGDATAIATWIVKVPKPSIALTPNTTKR